MVDLSVPLVDARYMPIMKANGSTAFAIASRSSRRTVYIDILREPTGVRFVFFHII